MANRRKRGHRAQYKEKGARPQKTRKRAKPSGSSRPVCGGRYQVPWDEYHGVPAGWTRAEIMAAHRLLGGVFSVDGTCTFGGVRPPTADEISWFEYRGSLYLIADGLRANDPACTELAIRYIELRHIGSYSGYIRALLARRLKHVDLSDSQQKRLVRHFEWIKAHDDYTQECREYWKLWNSIIASRKKKAVS